MTSAADATSARIRRATQADLEDLSFMLARSFARDTSYNWIKGATHTISSANTQDPGELEALEQMRFLQWSLACLYLVCGQIDLVVVTIEGREKIVACTCWVEPGKETDPGFRGLFRLRLFRIWRAWGLRPFKRMVLEFVPQVEKVEKQAFSTRGKNMKDAWHLGIVSTDPDHEGHGYVSMMLRNRFETIGPHPVYLEASSPRSRDVYAHFGFQLIEPVLLGAGKVDSEGLIATGEKATGVQNFIMVKWE
ncbi:unnamed protein product [Peniophora sp. CBMAI 1063]|nr:unnamed protein product [Peniophora sp. CBMAI 1063]